MATPGATIADRITDLIGSEYATVPNLSYKDLINAAFNEIVDNVFEELLMKYSRTPGRLEGDTEWLVEDRKILKSYLSEDIAENGKTIPEDNKKLVRYILKQTKKDASKITKL